MSRTTPQAFLRRLLPALLLSAWTLTSPNASANQDVGPSGLDFAGVTLPAPLQRADAIISGGRCWTWSVRGTQRLYIEQDVVVRIGVYQFNADRATFWMEPLEGPVSPLWQLAIYFENVSDPGADAAVSQTASRLLVTTIVQGDVTIRPDIFHNGAPAMPASSAFVTEGETRLARFLGTAQEFEPPASRQGPPEVVDRSDVRPVLSPERLDQSPAIDTASAQPLPIFAADGIISFYGPDRTLVSGEEESALVITGGVVVQYFSADGAQSLQMTGQSIVVFLGPGTISEILQFTAEDVRGIYLEGDVVATDGSYTLRGPRFYYDLRSDRGVALESVFWTYDEEKGMPLYLRADVIRQESQSQWTAGDARLANTSFFRPHYMIGATSVTLTRQARPDVEDIYTVDARGVEYRVGNVPVVRTPRLQGRVTGRRAPRVAFSTNNDKPVIETRWDFYSLLGIEPIDGLNADFLLDFYIDRGVAAGADFDWSGPYAEGKAFGTFIYDEGEDLLSSGAKINRNSEARGMVTTEHKERLTETLTLFGEGAYFSDPAFVDSFYTNLGRTGREYTNSLSLRYLDGRDFLSVGSEGPSNDFIVNQYLLQSKGYQVERFPEVRYARVGEPLANGVLNYTMDSRVGLLSARFTDEDASEYGLETAEQSMAGLDLALPGLSPADRLSAQGYTEENVMRADTRHEISLPLTMGPVNVEPFAVGRITAYDNEFSNLRPDGNDDKARFWGGGGVRMATTLQRINNSAHSRLLDINRMRHLMTPSLTLFSTATNLELGELQTYDERVESLLNGTLIRVGLANVWQTKRGGGSLRRSVDWLKIRTDYVWSSDETPQTSPIGRFFESRPELSTGGEFVSTDAVLQITDATALTTDWIRDTDLDETQTFAAGALFDHGRDFSSFIEYREVNPIDAEYLHFGAEYALTKRYRLDGSAAFNLDENSFQSIRATFSRRFAQLTAVFGVDFNDVQDNTSFSFSLRPLGVDAESSSSRLLRRSSDALDLSELPMAPSDRVGQSRIGQ